MKAVDPIGRLPSGIHGDGAKLNGQVRCHYASIRKQIKVGVSGNV